MSSVGAMRAALAGMRARQWGRVVLVTSIAAREPVANLLLSNALRAGLHGLVNALSKEIAADGVTVNALMPGYTMTERLGAYGSTRPLTRVRFRHAVWEDPRISRQWRHFCARNRRITSPARRSPAMAACCNRFEGRRWPDLSYEDVWKSLQDFRLPETLGFGLVPAPVMYSATYENGQWSRGQLLPLWTH